MSESLRIRCPICRYPTAVVGSQRAGVHDIDCPNCGRHQLDDEGQKLLSLPGYDDEPTRARIAFGVRRLNPKVYLSAHVLDELGQATKLPGALERLDNVVLYLADQGIGRRVDLVPQRLTAAIGTEGEAEANWAIEQTMQRGWIDGDVGAESFADVTLTAKGWERVSQLMRDAAGSRHAFMAMKFGDPALDVVFRDYMRPAVARAGFELRRTDGQHATAGLIDNRMRVEIRTSRFVVCDLSHGNQGAYWEAGFAEGLGRPVFYVCSIEAFDSRDERVRPHFDIAHQPIVKWDPRTPEAGMQQLTDMIRATLPAEAVQEDPPE